MTEDLPSGIWSALGSTVAQLWQNSLIVDPQQDLAVGTPDVQGLSLWGTFMDRVAYRQNCLASERMTGRLNATRVIPLTESLALLAADLSLRHGLAMADAQDAELITGDADLKALPGVVYVN